MRRFLSLVVLAVVFGLAGAFAGVTACRLGGWPRSEPRTIFDVARVARDRGLVARGDSKDGQIKYTLVISRRPLTYEQICDGHVAVRRYTGIVYATEHAEWVISRDDKADLYWGEIALNGDPALIDELIRGR